jgi:hypothetical protein
MARNTDWGCCPNCNRPLEWSSNDHTSAVSCWDDYRNTLCYLNEDTSAHIRGR